MRLPDPVAMADAALLTWVAELVKKPPVLVDDHLQYGGLKKGLQGDGCKAEWADHSLLKDVGRAHAIEHELAWHRLGKLIDGFPPCAMHGHNVIRADLLHCRNGWLNDGIKNWPRKVEPAQNCMHRVHLRNFLGMFHRVYDPGVRTSTDDDQPLVLNLDCYPLVIVERIHPPVAIDSRFGPGKTSLELRCSLHLPRDQHKV